MNERPQSNSVVTCQQLRIVADDGKLRALLACMNDRPLFQMYDADGRVRFEAQVNLNGTPSFLLWDEHSAPVISMGMSEDNSRGLTICGERGLPVLTLKVTEENEVQITTLPFPREDDSDAEEVP
jgi:hypothetical protein